MIVAQGWAVRKGREGAVDRARREVGELVAETFDGAHGGLVDVERGLFEGLLRIGRDIMAFWFAAQGNGDVGETVEHEGRTLQRLPVRPKRYVSVFGEIMIQRVAYAVREGQKQELVPLDAALGLPEGDFSYLLQSWDQKFCVQNSFDRSRLAIEEILGIGQSVRSLEHMNASMATCAADYRASQKPPAPDEEGEILVVTADGKGVPMKRNATEPTPPSRRNKGQKANKKRMACVGAVYSIDRFPRTAQSVVNEVLRKARCGDRPTPRHKQLRAELTREIDGQLCNGKDRTIAWLADQVAARRVNDAQPVVCVMDGEQALWRTVKAHLPSAVGVLDIFHVMERLWDAAHCFFAEGSAAARTFVTDRLDQLLCGKVGYVIGGMKQMATKRGLKGTRWKRLQSVLTYFHNNRRFMKYDQYLAAGFPIGSGVAEGACRHLVKDRLELTGMRWSTPGAQAMLDLRAIYINGDWDTYQDFRMKQECQRLYPHREHVAKLLRNAA